MWQYYETNSLQHMIEVFGQRKWTYVLVRRAWRCCLARTRYDAVRARTNDSGVC